MKKRIISLLLSLTIVLTFLPTIAFADIAETDVASVNGTGYATLREAFVAAASEGETEVVVERDITAATFSNSNDRISLGEGTYVLNLNGHTVDASVQQALNLYGTHLTIYGSGSLSSDKAATLALWNSTVNPNVPAEVTLLNGTIGGKGYAVYLGGASTFNLENGTVQSESGTTIQIAGSADGATVNIDDGYVLSGGQNAIQNWGKNSTINVYGGYLGAYSDHTLNFAICSRNYTDPKTGNKYSSEGAKITVTGGELNALNSVEIQPGELAISGAAELTGAISVGGKTAVGKAIIEDGTFEGNLLARNNGTYEISGGTFRGKISYITMDDGNNPIETENPAERYAISGGVFADDVSAFVIEGVTVVAITNDSETQYAVGDDIKDSIEDGDTVAVLKGSTVETNPDVDATITNETGAPITVNGTTVAAEGNINPKTEADKAAAAAAAAQAAADKAAADAVTAKINDLPAAADITIDNKAAVEEARAAYDKLTASQKNRISADTLKKLTDAEAALQPLVEAKEAADKAAADPVQAAIDAIPAADQITVDNKAAVEAVRAAYDALTDDQKALISADTLKKLTDAEEAVARAEEKAAEEKAAADKKAADEVIAQINALPAADQITLEDKAAVEAARTAYDALTDDQKALVDADASAPAAKLAAAEAKVKEAADKAAADAVISKINALPKTVTADDEKAITAARKAYDALTADQKALVDSAAVTKLTKAEKAYKTADAKAKKVKAVTVNSKKVTAAAIKKAIKKAGGSAKYVTKITIGKKVTKISKKAFKSFKKVKTLVIKSKKLKKASVKNSLKGSKVTKVKVKVGKKAVNKKYVKKYKKFFTKKNAGKKVTVS